ncbi:MAG: hypothetical protein ACPLKQ_06805 [Candidatus Bathyarchaeales archaeon]
MVEMKPKFLPAATVVFLVFSLILLGFQRFAFVSAVSEFSLSEIDAEILVVSPVDNGSYTGDIPLNISIRFGAFSRIPNASLIPYQKVSCLYKVDNGEWKNASLVYASEQGGRWHPTHAAYWNEVICNYSALLQGLSNGWHVLTITLKPDGIHYWRIAKAGEKSYTLEPIVFFHVFGNYNEPIPQIEKALTITVITPAILILSVLLILRKTRKAIPIRE